MVRKFTILILIYYVLSFDPYARFNGYKEAR